jgi:hypothetical protein
MSEREPIHDSNGKPDKHPLWDRMYTRQHMIDLVRMVGYSGLPIAEAQAKIKEMPHDKDKMVAACEELFDIDGNEVRLKANVRKLSFQLLGPPPEYKETPIREMLGLDKEQKRKEVPKPEPKRKKPRKKNPASGGQPPAEAVQAPGGAERFQSLQQGSLPNKSKKATTAPLMAQYREAKERHPDMLLLFRMGDFYELFDQDAEKAAKLLGLTLTTRDRTTTMAGFPHHQLESYLHKLLKAGDRVAICDQVYSADGKSVKREVQRVVMAAKTPDETADELEEVIGQIEEADVRVIQVGDAKTNIPVKLRNTAKRSAKDGPYAEGD